MRATRHKDGHRYCDLSKSSLSRHSADETLNGVNDSRRLFARNVTHGSQNETARAVDPASGAASAHSAARRSMTGKNLIVGRVTASQIRSGGVEPEPSFPARDVSSPQLVP